MLDLAPHRSGLNAFTRRWRVAKLELFGSALRDDFGPASDVDVLLTFEPDAGWSLFDLVDMKADLESIFSRSVDVTTRAAVERSANWIRRDAILDSARAVHAQP